MDSAARLPAATASITDLGPTHCIAPGENPSSEVWRVTGSALKYRPWVCDADVADEFIVAGLPDGRDDLIGLDGEPLLLVIDRIEPPVGTEDLRAFLQLDAGDAAVAEDSARSPAVA